MTHRIVEATQAGEFTLHLRFADGTEGDVDLREELYGEVFLPLRDPAYFSQFTLHPELHTITWPNGADFAPEFLHAKVQVPA